MSQNLINLLQIKGGSKLRTDVDTLLAGIDAKKVNTDIVKTAADGATAAVNYNANELLASLKTSVDSLTGGSGSTGSVTEQIATAKAAVEAEIKTINDKEVKDNVRLFIPAFASIDSVSVAKVAQADTYALSEADDGTVKLATAKMSALTDFKGYTTGVAYNVYDLNNKPILTKEKKNVGATITSDGAATPTYTVKFNGTPATFSEKATKTDVASEGVTLGTDNVTLKLANTYVDKTTVVVKNGNDQVSAKLYDIQALAGKIVFSSEQTAGTAYTVSYSYTKYEEVATEMASYASTVSGDDTTALMWKFFPVMTCKFSELSNDYLLDNDEVNQIAMQNAITTIADDLSKQSGIIQQIINQVGEGTLTNAVANLSTALQAQIDAIKTDVALLKNKVVDFFTPTANQTAFELTKVPTANKVDVFINGVHYAEDGTSVKIDRSTVGTDGNKGIKASLTWAFTSDKNGFDIDETDEVVVEYFDSSKVVYSAQA